jgi:hypothetical protein
MCIAVSVLGMSTLWLSIKSEVPTVWKIHYVINHDLLHFMYIQFWNLQFIRLGDLCTGYAWGFTCGLWLLMIYWNILHQFYCLHRQSQYAVSIFPHIITQQQSLYEACSVSDVLMIFFFTSCYFVVWSIGWNTVV